MSQTMWSCQVISNRCAYVVSDTTNNFRHQAMEPHLEWTVSSIFLLPTEGVWFSAVIPCSRSSVMILVVWFQVLSMKTTLWTGQVCFSGSSVSSGEQVCEPPLSSTFSFFTPLLSGGLSAPLFSPVLQKWVSSSSTVIASGPGNTSTTCRHSTSVKFEEMPLYR